jgi:hypothetical protein
VIIEGRIGNSQGKQKKHISSHCNSGESIVSERNLEQKAYGQQKEEEFNKWPEMSVEDRH